MKHTASDQTRNYQRITYVGNIVQLTIWQFSKLSAIAIIILCLLMNHTASDQTGSYQRSMLESTLVQLTIWQCLWRRCPRYCGRQKQGWVCPSPDCPSWRDRTHPDGHVGLGNPRDRQWGPRANYTMVHWCTVKYYRILSSKRPPPF